jgi:hypothetical protein
MNVSLLREVKPLTIAKSMVYSTKRGILSLNLTIVDRDNQIVKGYSSHHLPHDFPKPQCRLLSSNFTQVPPFSHRVPRSHFPLCTPISSHTPISFPILRFHSPSSNLTRAVIFVGRPRSRGDVIGRFASMSAVRLNFSDFLKKSLPIFLFRSRFGILSSPAKTSGNTQRKDHGSIIGHSTQFNLWK